MKILKCGSKSFMSHLTFRIHMYSNRIYMTYFVLAISALSIFGKGFFLIAFNKRTLTNISGSYESGCWIHCQYMFIENHEIVRRVIFVTNRPNSFCNYLQLINITLGISPLSFKTIWKRHLRKIIYILITYAAI